MRSILERGIYPPWKYGKSLTKMKTKNILPPNLVYYFVLVLLIGVLSVSAPAHEVWIEDTPDGQLVVRFAEYGDDFEKSPGPLDALNPLSAWSSRTETLKEGAAAGKGGPESRQGHERQDLGMDSAETVQIKKNKDHFLLVGLSSTKAAQMESDFTVMGTPENSEKPARKPFFYARWQPPGAIASQPSLNFDIVPTGNAGEARVFFRGKPLPAVKVKFHPPEGAEEELISDNAGLIHFDDSKPGFYLLCAAHQREATSGFSRGKAYDVISHNCSLSWRKNG
jgi:hypothetical protein